MISSISSCRRVIQSAIAALFLSGASISLAAISDADAVNKSGQQRMLSQRIARSYILTGLNINPQQTQKELDESLALFDQNLNELHEYATQDNVKTGLDKVDTLWQRYRSLTINQPRIEDAPVVLKTSDELLAACEDVVKQIVANSGASTAKLVAVSGRQRMLSQRIAKFYLAMTWKVPSTNLEPELVKAMQEFETALSLLESAKENTPQISDDLRRVRAQWDFAKEGFKQYQKGRFTPVVITSTTNSMLKKMHEITGEYSKVMGSQLANQHGQGANPQLATK